MSLKSAALLALIGISVLTVVIAVGFIFNLLAFIRGLIPAVTLLHSLVHLFASVALSIFFYVFHRAQS